MPSAILDRPVVTTAAPKPKHSRRRTRPLSLGAKKELILAGIWATPMTAAACITVGGAFRFGLVAIQMSAPVWWSVAAVILSFAAAFIYIAVNRVAVAAVTVWAAAIVTAGLAIMTTLNANPNAYLF